MSDNTLNPMTTQEINSLYEELESILVRKFPPEEYGEDADLSSICTIAQELRDELLKCTKEKNELAERAFLAGRSKTSWEQFKKDTEMLTH